MQDSIAYAVDKQKQNADKNGRANVLLFKVNDLVLLSTVNLPKNVVTNVGSTKLLPKYIGPFRVLHRKGNAYTLELPRRMRTHPTFYVGRLRPYCQYAASSAGECNHPAQESLRDSCGHEPDSQAESAVTRPCGELTTARQTPPACLCASDASLRCPITNASNISALSSMLLWWITQEVG